MLITSFKIASCAELDGSVSGSDFTEANDGVRVLVGAPVSIISTRQLHVNWLIVFEKGKTTHFQNGSQRFKYLVGTSGLAKKERDRDREAQSQQWQSVCN